MVALADVAVAEVGGEADPAEVPGRAGVWFEEVRLAGRPGVAPLVQAISWLSWAGLTRVSWTGQWASMNSTNAAISSGVLSASMW